ncbi:MAG: regulatory iron-sulfur-containing complex subunit RicT, partial [Chloroflexota bacterium]
MATTSVAEGLVGVRFVEAGPISYCSPDGLSLGTGDYVVVRTDRGERLGWVVLAADQTQGARFDGPVRVIDRLAGERDVQAYREQQARATEDIVRVQAIATRRDQRVRVASLMYDLDGRHADITFVAREQEEADWLRREAARQLDANVQVEQVGDRDRAKSAGGIGQCGRALCCATWQVEFPAISIKMAKDQGLAPNPSKISGVCGRLLCCCPFELEAYRVIMGTLPKVGMRISTPVGRAKVLSINALSETVRMRMDETGEVVEMPAAALREQYGTAVRPVDLEESLEAPLHEQDRDRRDHFLGVLEPVAMPTAPRRPEGRPDPRPRPTRDDDRPRRDRTERTARPSSADRPPRPPRGGAPRDGAPRDGARDGAAAEDRA